MYNYAYILKKEENVMRYKNVIFDLDGTLLNTIDDLTDSVNYVMKQFGFNQYTTDTIEGFLGNGIHRLMESAVPEGVENDRFQEAFDMFKDYYTRNCLIKTAPYDGIIQLLSDLKEMGCSLAIVSNKNEQAVLRLFKIFFDKYADMAVGQTENSKKKPNPESLFYVMDKLGASKKDTLYVGDSEVDKETADNAGVDCALVSWGFRKRDFLLELKPEYMADSPYQLGELLKNI